MASGKQHAQASLLLAGAGVTSALIYPREGLLIAAGAMLGLVLSPDLDVDNPTYSDYVVRKWFGTLLAWLWFAFWFPYRKLVPHRHWFSHAPIIGTLFRVGYIGIPVGYWLGWQTLPYAALVWVITGLALSDILHYIMDQI